MSLGFEDRTQLVVVAHTVVDTVGKAEQVVVPVDRREDVL